MRRNYSRSLPLLRGYVSTAVFWALLEEGFLDATGGGRGVPLEAYAAERGLDPSILRSLCEYLEGAGLFSLEGDECRLTAAGRAVMAEPRGIYELVRGYRPLFRALDDILSGKKRYGVDILKDGAWVAGGTGRLGAQLPFPVLAEVVRRRGYGRVLDLKCNDGTLLLMLAEAGARACWGIDDDTGAVESARSRISSAGLADGIDVWRGDLFDVKSLAARCGEVDLLVAFDLFHEHLGAGPERVLKLMGDLRASFPRAHLLLAEFCRLPRERLRSRSKPFLEHELIHALTGQKVLSEAEWEGCIAATPYRVIEKRVFGLIGHGYFLLE